MKRISSSKKELKRERGFPVPHALHSSASGKLKDNIKLFALYAKILKWIVEIAMSESEQELKKTSFHKEVLNYESCG